MGRAEKDDAYSRLYDVLYFKFIRTLRAAEHLKTGLAYIGGPRNG